MIKNKNVIPIIFILVILEILDIITTFYGLSAGATEINKFVAYIISNYGYVGLIVTKLIDLIIVSFLFIEFAKLSTPKLVNCFGYFLIVIGSLVVVINTISLYLKGVI